MRVVLPLFLTFVCGSACGSSGPNLVVVRAPDLQRKLLARLAASRKHRRTLDAVARVESYGRRGVIKGRVTVLADAAGRLRVDGWSPTDDLVATFCGSSGRFGYFERGGDHCLVGELCARNVERFIPLWMSFNHVIAIFMGLPPMLEPASAWSLALDDASGAYVLSSAVHLATKRSGYQYVWLREDGTAIRYQLDLDGPGREHYVLEADRFRTVAGLSFPYSLRIEANGAEIDLRYREVHVNVALNDDDFVFECPKGVPTRVISCTGEAFWPPESDGNRAKGALRVGPGKSLQR